MAILIPLAARGWLLLILVAVAGCSGRRAVTKIIAEKETTLLRAELLVPEMEPVREKYDVSTEFSVAWNDGQDIYPKVQHRIDVDPHLVFIAKFGLSMPEGGGEYEIRHSLWMRVDALAGANGQLHVTRRALTRKDFFEMLGADLSDATEFKGFKSTREFSLQADDWTDTSRLIYEGREFHEQEPQY